MEKLEVLVCKKSKKILKVLTELEEVDYDSLKVINIKKENNKLNIVEEQATLENTLLMDVEQDKENQYILLIHNDIKINISAFLDEEYLMTLSDEDVEKIEKLTNELLDEIEAEEKSGVISSEQDSVLIREKEKIKLTKEGLEKTAYKYNRGVMRRLENYVELKNSQKEKEMEP